jgi:hypothetical protein
MADRTAFEREVSRRRFLAMGGALAAAGTVGRWLGPLDALAATSWPKGRLGAHDAVHVRDGQFMPVGQFRSWHASLDKTGPANQRGLRATGSSAHEAYVDQLVHELRRAGVHQVHTENVPMRRWTTDTWSLTVAGAPVKTASYIPYAGTTTPTGVTGELVYVDAASAPAPGSLAGKLAVFDLSGLVIPYSTFTALAYSGREYDPQHVIDPAAPYKRPYLSIDAVVAMLTTLDVAGAAGAVAILDYPYDAARGTYFPYDGVIRKVPGVYVDREVGATLRDQAKAGSVTATVSVPSTVKQVNSRNIIGFIPGQTSKELVTLHCHTDGSNALEDNGPGAIVAISQYLSRLPKHALPRTVMILLTTGHFAGGNGSRAFVSRHRNDLAKRTNAAITIEHLGTREWIETAPGQMALTGRSESGAIFTPGSTALVDASFAALKRGKAAPGDVLRPLNPRAAGDPNDAAWPGEGQYLYAKGAIPTANYITGPTYLLNWGIPTLDKVDFSRVRREAIGFTEAILKLTRTPRGKLRHYDLG